jgi:hypothetical protein
MSDFSTYMDLYGTPALDRGLGEALTYQDTEADEPEAVTGRFSEQEPVETDRATGTDRERRATVRFRVDEVVPVQYGLITRVSTGEVWSIRDWPVVEHGVAQMMCTYSDRVAMRRPGTRG